MRFVAFADFWAPVTTSSGYDDPTRIMGFCQALILARSKAEFPAIRSEFIARLRDVDLSVEGDYDMLTAVPETLFETLSRAVFHQGRTTESSTGTLLTLIGGLMVLFMVLPAVNLVNLNISRIMERASEIGVRKAFGASSVALVGQFLVENVLLTLAGGVLALAFSKLVLELVAASGVVPGASFHVNVRVLGYALLLALVFGLISGVYPAWRMSRLNPVDALKGGQG